MGAFDLRPDAAALLVIDVQERFLPAIPAIAGDQPCGRNLRILVQAAGLLGVPVTISEQYPKGLGPTLPDLLALAPPGHVRLAKTAFSCAGDPALATHLAGLGRPHLVLAGIEAHVCVLATAADLLAHGRQVTVAADAVASRSEANRDHALATLRQLGALVLPTEAIVLRLQREASGPTFKALSALIR